MDRRQENAATHTAAAAVGLALGWLLRSYVAPAAPAGDRAHADAELEGRRYRVLQACQVREGFEMGSAKVCALKRGDVVRVVEERLILRPSARDASQTPLSPREAAAVAKHIMAEAEAKASTHRLRLGALEPAADVAGCWVSLASSQDNEALLEPLEDGDARPVPLTSSTHRV